MQTPPVLFKLLLASVLAWSLTACGNNSSSDAVTPKTLGVAATSLAVDAHSPPATSVASEPLLKARDVSIAPTPVSITLDTPPASQTSAATEGIGGDSAGKPLQIGFSRDVVATSTAATTRQMLKWQATASGGKVAAISFNSPTAKGLRLGLLVNQLPSSATLRFYAKGASSAVVVSGADVKERLARNLAAGDNTDAGRTYKSPVMEGSEGTLEIELPAGVVTEAVDVAVPKVSHLFSSLNQAAQSVYQNPVFKISGLSCQVDVMCSTPLPVASNAVAFVIFDVGASTYTCSGTLLNDSINSSTPYFLSANHCLSTQTSASTLDTYWFYRSSACNSLAGNAPQLGTTGATLLYTAYPTDTTLVRLDNAPPTGVLFAGWDATTMPVNALAITGIHHPKGDPQRISTGSVVGGITRSTTNASSFFSAPTPTASTPMLKIKFTNGLTEPGSSGSGLFKGSNSNPQLIGQLFGWFIAAETCTYNANASNIYGRFDVAYNAGMGDWLTQGQDVKSVIQVYSASAGVHYYTTGLADATTFASSNATYSNQGAMFKVNTAPLAGLSPVYRFYDTINGTYFYTISEKERAAVATNTPRMRFDGVVWYASAAATASNTMPLYRALNTTTGSQYFSTDSVARASLMVSKPQFKADGIAYYVAP